MRFLFLGLGHEHQIANRLFETACRWARHSCTGWRSPACCSRRCSACRSETEPAGSEEGRLGGQILQSTHQVFKTSRETPASTSSHKYRSTPDSSDTHSLPAQPADPCRADC